MNKIHAKRVERLLRKRGIEPEEFDIEAYWDSTLTPRENLNLILNLIGLDPDYQKDSAEYIESNFLRGSKNILKREFIVNIGRENVTKRYVTGTIKLRRKELEKFAGKRAIVKIEVFEQT